MSLDISRGKILQQTVLKGIIFPQQKLKRGKNKWPLYLPLPFINNTSNNPKTKTDSSFDPTGEPQKTGTRLPSRSSPGCCDLWVAQQSWDHTPYRSLVSPVGDTRSPSALRGAEAAGQALPGVPCSTGESRTSHCSPRSYEGVPVKR